MISALRSGEGKTLITLGLLRILREAGIRVQPFKVGPDYIDPQWHRFAGGVPSYNLDLFAMGNERVKHLFWTKSRDKEIAIVEGVMGLFDGKYSTFSLAKLLRIPVILVVDTFGLAETIKPLVKGTVERLKRANLPFALILNRISSERHLLRIERALRGYPILGYLRRDKGLEIASRHLGLNLPEDPSSAEGLLEYLAERLREGLNLDLLENFTLIPPDEIRKPRFLPEIPYRTLAIAYDRAFNFYYQHLLDELGERTKILFFSPLDDSELPSEAEALYLGGGYPELYAEKLAQNRRLIDAIRDWVNSGRPLYAECGGFVYLCRALKWNGKVFEFAGLFPYEIIKGSLVLGYRWVKPRRPIPLFESELSFRGHEFHYTVFLKDSTEVEKCYRVRDQQGRTYSEGYLRKSSLGSYIHLIAFDL